MSTRVKSGRGRFTYSHTIGMSQPNGARGFSHPTEIATSSKGLLYVINRPGFIKSFSGSFKTVISIVSPDHQYIGQFGSVGEEDGQFCWPACLAFSRQNNLFVTDEFLSRISIFDAEGNFLSKWGRNGSGEGELKHPSGIAFDKEDNLYIADTLNHRIQRFTQDGTYLGQWGSYGADDGQFNMPWGITTDASDDVYVVDWRNDRVQKFSPDGDFLLTLGRPGSGDAEFNRPSHITVDDEGYIYVTDRNNDRVQVYSPDATFVTMLLGDAELSPWQEEFLEISPDQRKQREKADLSVEKWFYRPMGLDTDREGRIFIADSGRNRIQAYQKV